MKELIKLLNEYEKENGRNFEVTEIGMTYRNNDLMVISKRYGFIKRLVDNDKIDINEINNNHLDVEIFYKQTYGPNYGEGGYGEIDYWYKCIGLYESLLCNLAISDTPIEDLISYLK